MAGASRTIGHLYDSDGNRVRITHPDSFFTYEYDGLSRFTRLRENGGEPLAVSIYDAAGRRSRSGWAAATDYAYDPAGRLQSLSHDLDRDERRPDARLHLQSGQPDPQPHREQRRLRLDGRGRGQPALLRSTATTSIPASARRRFGYDPNGNLISRRLDELRLRRREPAGLGASGAKNAPPRLRPARPAVPGVEPGHGHHPVPL